jgi:hypothetical protein
MGSREDAARAIGKLDLIAYFDIDAHVQPTPEQKV